MEAQFLIREELWSLAQQQPYYTGKGKKNRKERGGSHRTPLESHRWLQGSGPKLDFTSGLLKTELGILVPPQPLKFHVNLVSLSPDLDLSFCFY